MGTQKGGYFLKDGTKVPSVTTVISRFKDSGALIWWAWNEGKEGRDYRDTRDRAASAGTMAHALVEAHIHKQPRPLIFDDLDTTVIARAEKAFAAFLEWAQQTNLQVTHTEMPLVSEQYKFGGTFDAILLGNRRAMGDWKSSNGVYGDYLVQLAAYGQLWRENFPDQPIDGGFHLLRFDKTYGDFVHHWWGELDKQLRQFLIYREAYELDKETKARAK